LTKANKTKLLAMLLYGRFMRVETKVEIIKIKKMKVTWTQEYQDHRDLCPHHFCRYEKYQESIR
jgi:hypothetical protein